MRPVAAGDEVAGDRADLSAGAKVERRPRGERIADRDLIHLEHDLASGGEPRTDEILHPLLLRVQRDPLAAGERFHVDVVRAALEAQVHAAMEERLAIQARAHAALT